MQDENITKKIFGRILTGLVKGKLRQSDVAERAGVTQSAVSQYITGVRLPGANELLNLSRALGVSMEYLLTGQHPGGAAALPDADDIRRDERRRWAARLKKILAELEA